MLFLHRNNNNNLYCALDTKRVKTLKALKGNNCEKKREHSHSEIARANRAEWLGHAEKQLDIKIVINKQIHTDTQRRNI